MEQTTFALGAAVVKGVCGIWLGGNPIATSVSNSIIDAVAGQLRTEREQRQFKRARDQIAELVAERVETMLEREFRTLPEYERLAAIHAVKEVFESAQLTDDDLFARDLDAGYMDRHLGRATPGLVEQRQLSTDGAALFRLLRRECCAYLIELVQNLPSSGIAGVRELLRRDTQIQTDLRTVLERLPARRGVADFEADYRQLIANHLDRIQLFGANVSDATRRYPLSVAYLSLSVSSDLAHRPDGSDTGLLPWPPDHRSAIGPTARVEQVLAISRRLFIRGQAGLGKTTLLHWIAVQCARSSFERPLQDWNGVIPFFLPLRRYAEGALPTPEKFLGEAGRHIADEMPRGWVQQQLRDGRAALLVDGVDELAEHRRSKVRDWLHDLVTAFPRARYVVTSRPAAAPSDLLGDEDFDVAELEPMTPQDVRVFVRRWHRAMRESADGQETEELTQYEEKLLAQIDAQAHLRRLAGYPLLCALLCALHRERRAQLPGSRMELYDVALQMLLERRDQEREIHSSVSLTRTEKTLLLQNLAYWLIRNGWSDVLSPRAVDLIRQQLTGMPQIKTDAHLVYRHLLERSGLIREPIEGRVDFAHRTFQEYLAAQAVIDADDIGALTANAHLDQWREVTVMAAGHAPRNKREELLTGLLDQAFRSRRRDRDALRLTAVACLETSPELGATVRTRVAQAAADLLPPKTLSAARSIAASGEFALDLLATCEPKNFFEIQATIQAAAEIGGPGALAILERWGNSEGAAVVDELLRAWPKFDPEEYALRVLRHSPLHDGRVTIDDPRHIPALRHLTKLRDLLCNFTDEAADYGFARDLPTLRSLYINKCQALSSLEGLAGASIAELFLGGHSDLLLDLRTLPTLANLERLYITSHPVSGVEALAGLPQLRRLWLQRLPANELGALSRLTDLENLSLGRLPGHEDLAALDFLTAPRCVQVSDWPDLHDVRVLSRWEESLEILGLSGCTRVDLNTLPRLTKLMTLNIQNVDTDLEPVARLPALELLNLGGKVIPDLRPLRHSPALRTLDFSGADEVDLSGLVGVKNLEIWSDQSTVFHGAEALGEGCTFTHLRSGPVVAAP